MTKENEKVASELLAKREKRESDISAKEAAELRQSLSVQERLERKFKTDVVEIVMKDDIGDFTLRFRKLSPTQQERLQELVVIDLTKVSAEEKEKLNDELYRIVAAASLDGVSVEFWKDKTGYSTGDFVTIIAKLASDSGMPDKKYLDEIVKFRK